LQFTSTSEGLLLMLPFCSAAGAYPAAACNSTTTCLSAAGAGVAGFSASLTLAECNAADALQLWIESPRFPSPPPPQLPPPLAGNNVAPPPPAASATPSPGACIAASQHFYASGVGASQTLTNFGTGSGGTGGTWVGTQPGGAIAAVDVSGSAGYPGWAPPAAWYLTGSNYVDFGTATFGGVFSIAVLSRKRATPAGNDPVFDFASSADGVTIFYQNTGDGPVFGYYDGRSYLSYISDASPTAGGSSPVANGVWNHDVLVFAHPFNDAAACAAAGATDGRTGCATVAAYRNGALVAPYGPDSYYGYSGRNPALMGFVGGIYTDVDTKPRAGLYIGKSNWPQSGFVGDVADFALFQDVALTPQNVSDLYAGALRMC
jgi:hypothetical protein